MSKLDEMITHRAKRLAEAKVHKAFSVVEELVMNATFSMSFHESSDSEKFRGYIKEMKEVIIPYTEQSIIRDMQESMFKTFLRDYEKVD